MARSKNPSKRVGLVDDVMPHSRDSEIVQAISLAKQNLGESDDLLIALKNEAGVVYRYCTINGLHQEIELAERLELLGLVDEYIQGVRKLRGVWGLFGPGLDMSREAVLARAIAQIGTKD